jgi:MtN3 and saliva related transmembrane protein
MEIIGIAAGLLTLGTYVPQAIKTIRSKQTKDLSRGTYILLVTSAFLWVVYGLGQSAPSIWVTNGVVGILGVLILVLKIKNS